MVDFKKLSLLGFAKPVLVLLSILLLTTTASGWYKSKRTNLPMKTYPMGRFSVDVPVFMKQAIQEQRIRSCDVSEFVWPTGKSKDQVRDEVYKARLAEINKLERPEKVKAIIMDDRIISGTGQWARGVFYYGNHYQDDEGYWDVLVDAGPIGVWLKFDGILKVKEEMFKWVVVVAKAYKTIGYDDFNKLPPGNWFYLQHGALNLPYLEQEHTYARFEGHPLDLKFEIEMNETQEVEKEGLIEKLATLLASTVTPGLDIKKIRTNKRKVAGIKGEEIILKMTEDGESKIQFAWKYHGKEDSGEYPEIEITMESPDGNLNEKLKIWDAVLDSMKPMFERKR